MLRLRVFESDEASHMSDHLGGHLPLPGSHTRRVGCLKVPDLLREVLDNFVLEAITENVRITYRARPGDLDTVEVIAMPTGNSGDLLINRWFDKILRAVADRKIHFDSEAMDSPSYGWLEFRESAGVYFEDASTADPAGSAAEAEAEVRPPSAIGVTTGFQMRDIYTTGEYRSAIQTAEHIASHEKVQLLSVSIVNKEDAGGFEWVTVQCDEFCVPGDGGANESHKRFRINAQFSLVRLEVSLRNHLEPLIEALRMQLDCFKPQAWVGGFKISRFVTKDHNAVCDVLPNSCLHLTLDALASVPSHVLPDSKGKRKRRKRRFKSAYYHMSLRDVGFALPGQSEDVDPQYVDVPNALQ